MKTLRILGKLLIGVLKSLTGLTAKSKKSLSGAKSLNVGLTAGGSENSSKWWTINVYGLELKLSPRKLKEHLQPALDVGLSLKNTRTGRLNAQNVGIVRIEI